MAYQQLIDYIKQQSAAGVVKPDIRKALVDVGWKLTDIDEAFDVIDGKTPAAPIVKPQPMPVQQGPVIDLDEKPVVVKKSGMGGLMWTILIILILASGAVAVYLFVPGLSDMVGEYIPFLSTGTKSDNSLEPVSTTPDTTPTQDTSTTTSTTPSSSTSTATSSTQ